MIFQDLLGLLEYFLFLAIGSSSLPNFPRLCWLSAIFRFKLATINISYMHLSRVALPLWRWRGCKAPKTPIFSAAKWLHIFADCLCCHPKTHFFCEMWVFRSLSPKDPLFLAFGCHIYFLFQFHRQIDNFCHFSTIFFKFLLLKRSLKDQK